MAVLVPEWSNVCVLFVMLLSGNCLIRTLCEVVALVSTPNLMYACHSFRVYYALTSLYIRFILFAY